MLDLSPPYGISNFSYPDLNPIDIDEQSIENRVSALIDLSHIFHDDDLGACEKSFELLSRLQIIK